MAAGAPFASSLDFESQMPLLAQASADARGAVRLDSVRQAVRRLFGLLRDNDAEREAFLARAAEELTEPIRDEIARQMRRRTNAYDYWEERGGLPAATAAERGAIVRRYESWISDQLEPWMASIYPVLHEDVWVGERDAPGGVLDLLLLADAIGLHTYNWGLDPEQSPFRRLDVVASSEPWLVVLGELYSQSIGAIA